MSLKAQAAGVAIGAAVIVLGLWYVKRKASGALDSIGSTLSGWASDAGTAISDTSSAGWDLANTPQTNLGPANGIATGIVTAPAGALDGLSLGLIGGSGGNAGNGGLGAWLLGIIDGDAFKPSSEGASGAFDLGTGPSW